jgi:MFS family permease
MVSGDLNQLNLAGLSSRERAASHDAQTIDLGEVSAAVFMGRCSEHFDFFVYAIASVLVFPTLFFPFLPALDATLASFAMFSLAFIARPLGTSLLMYVQKRSNRTTKLIVALFLLGFSTAGMAFVPSYAFLGPMAIVLLAMLRIGQGLAVGGSWDGFPSLLALNAPAKKRGWYAMLGQLGSPLGFAIATGAFWYFHSQLSNQDFLEWGWRYPFFVAFVLNMMALFLRFRLVTSAKYTRLLDDNALIPPPQFSQLLISQKRNILLGALAALASYALFHVVTVFPLSWIVLNTDRSINDFLLIQMVGAGFAALGMIASGVIADQFGRRHTLAGVAVLIGIFSVTTPLLIGGGQLGQNLYIFVGFILVGLSYGQASGATASNFPSIYRYMGAALSADLSWLLGAAFAPLIVLWLTSHYGLAYVGLYLLSGAVTTLLALILNHKLEKHE